MIPIRSEEVTMRKILALALAATGLAACQRAQEPAIVNIFSYQCGEHEVGAVFTEQERADLTIGERKLTLASVPAASGAKYADAQGNEFWTKGLDQGLLTLAGEEARSCTAPPR